MIINCISYIRIKANYTLFSLDDYNDSRTNHKINNVDQYFYIIEKGKIQMELDDNLYLLDRDHTISTKALVKNSKKKCTLKYL